MIEDLFASEMEYFEPMLKRNSVSSEKLSHAWRKETVAERLERVSLEVYDLCDGVISQGLFSGMQLGQDTWWGKSDLGSQCLGFYEKEILEIITANGPYDNFIDIGAADGYYAIGMLHSVMASRAICFEVSDKGRVAIRKNWQTNGSPGLLEILGEANEVTVSALSPVITTKSLVLIDIEGFEFELLTPKVVSILSKCDVIVEIHNWVEDFPNRYKSLLMTLDNYFRIEIVKRSDRNTVDCSLLRSFTDDNRLLVTSERRPCLMRFLHLSPKN